MIFCCCCLFFFFCCFYSKAVFYRLKISNSCSSHNKRVSVQEHPSSQSYDIFQSTLQTFSNRFFFSFFVGSRTINPRRKNIGWCTALNHNNERVHNNNNDSTKACKHFTGPGGLGVPVFLRSSQPNDVNYGFWVLFFFFYG